MRNSYVASIYEGLIKRKTILEIHQDLKRLTINANKKGITHTQSLERYALKLAKTTKKQLNSMMPSFEKQGSDIDNLICVWAFDLFTRKKVFSNTNSISYDTGKTYEADNKDLAIRTAIRTNRKLENPRIFYLASAHNDCASDHKDYQGKMYIDEKWQDLIKNEELKQEIQKYVNIHNVKTFQWVIGKPVWFITRPNCRHYVKSMKTEDVLGKSVETLIRNHKLHTKIGKELTKTITHSINKVWYKEENIADIIEKYKERLAFHKAMWDVKKSQPVKRAIEKDKLLIEKWEKMLKSLQK